VHLHGTHHRPIWPEPWPATQPAESEPGAYREQQWVLRVYRHADDLPAGNCWEWCRYTLTLGGNYGLRLLHRPSGALHNPNTLGDRACLR
jgi:hypothetical protein